MVMLKIQDVLDELSLIENDASVPRNVKSRIKNAISLLTHQTKSDMSLRIDKSLEELGDVAEDPNLPQYARMQIWSVVSQLEGK